MITQKTFLHLVAQAGFSTIPCVIIPNEFAPSVSAPWRIASADVLEEDSLCTIVPAPQSVSNMATKYGSDRFLVNLDVPVIACPVYTVIAPHYDPPAGFEDQVTGLLTKDQRHAWGLQLLEDPNLVGVMVSHSQTRVEVGSRFDLLPILDAISDALDSSSGASAVRTGICCYALVYLKVEKGNGVKRNLLVAGTQRVGYYQSLEADKQPETYPISEPTPDLVGTEAAHPLSLDRGYLPLTTSVVSLSHWGDDGVAQYVDFYQPVNISGYEVRTPSINGVLVSLDEYLNPNYVTLTKS